MFDPSTLNFNSILNKFAVCMKSVFIFWWKDVSSDMKSMKSVKIIINRQKKKRVCHRILPIDRYNRYQSNHIYRYSSIYRLKNRYRFLSIDYSGVYMVFRVLRLKQEIQFHHLASWTRFWYTISLFGILKRPRFFNWKPRVRSSSTVFAVNLIS